ncbi:alpha/beta fold hydrolase [Desulfocurvibacter africanus]|uniref:alpha/beta fold hydrolase n=1 Tax=Desulfocurvibacter africanus TaxID=873 RepID=UPI00040C00DC|nr:alpha/beta hydrolase [Desulfocurvibacter africanus]
MDKVNSGNLRRYGDAPFSVAVIHGGPGAAGEMAPVAKELSLVCSVLEPLQTVTSLEGQIQELQKVLENHAHLPITLIGHSWGAWLGLIFAAHCPSFVKKLILVGSGPFEEKYASSIIDTRLKRLDEQERLFAHSFMESLRRGESQDEKAAFAQFGKLMAKADTYDPLPLGVEEEVNCRGDIFRKVWEEARALRQSGGLLDIARQVRCPVVAIHGDYDPHPSEGVRNPLSLVINDFQFILLPNCGHKPWVERSAKDAFHRILMDAVN